VPVALPYLDVYGKAGLARYKLNGARSWGAERFLCVPVEYRAQLIQSSPPTLHGRMGSAIRTIRRCGSHIKMPEDCFGEFLVARELQVQRVVLHKSPCPARSRCPRTR
jgi:hypothetical protein